MRLGPGRNGLGKTTLIVGSERCQREKSRGGERSAYKLRETDGGGELLPQSQIGRGGSTS